MSDGQLQYLGPSDDGRTNRWSFTPGCGHKPFEPRTTMFVEQHVQCPRCGVEYLLNLNERSAHRLVDSDAQPEA